MKTYRLLAPDGTTYESAVPGKLGGNSREKIYGHLDCYSANAALPTYAKIRVFFEDEEVSVEGVAGVSGLRLDGTPD